MNDRPSYDHDALPPDELDGLLRRWHDENRSVADAGRARLLSALRDDATPARSRRRIVPAGRVAHSAHRFPRGAMLRAAASFILLAVAVTLVLPVTSRSATAAPVLFAEGGRLEAMDEDGILIGPCPLKHTDVQVAVSGSVARVTVAQRFENPYDEPIEALYTFPLGHRAAVDAMTMTVGERVVVGEVHERAEARAMYEAARASGYVASLLEQQRPNIFTQSVANIAPKATVVVEISYVEMVAVRDGVYGFDFPMTVAPRYIPGTPAGGASGLPAELTARHGIVLRGPARFILDGIETPERPALDATGLQGLVRSAQPIAFPGELWWGAATPAAPAWVRFRVEYADGSQELGLLHVDGTGQINGRWFYVDPSAATRAGGGFAADTDLVPDASLITPRPVRPARRAGHDVSVAVSIDTGGPAITSHRSIAHDVIGGTTARGRQLALELTEARTIPNRDFRLEWTVADERIEDALLVHRRPRMDGGPAPFGATLAGAAPRDPWGPIGHGFFTLILQPPARIAPDEITPRELVFVLDSSGSMKDFPIETAKAMLTQAVDAMGDRDVFNVVTFNTTWERLWPEPRPASGANRDAARAWIDGRQGGGGTEMRPAVLAALTPVAPGEGELRPADLAELPADGRAVSVLAPASLIHPSLDPAGHAIQVRHDLTVAVRLPGGTALPEGTARMVRLAGTWRTDDARRLLDVESVEPCASVDDVERTRYVLFLSDGEVGNDDAVIDAVAVHARDTRVFTVGIGSSPNRWLLDEMAAKGRGVADYVANADEASAAVERFARRIEAPVLTNITLDFDGDFAVLETIPALDRLPDLVDRAPLVVHGRYGTPGRGTVTVRGLTGGGPFERRIAMDLADASQDHDVIASLWARAKVDAARDANDRDAMVRLGTAFQLLTEHTSFVAVETAKSVIDGVPRLVRIPIELPEGQSWSGTFGHEAADGWGTAGRSPEGPGQDAMQGLERSSFGRTALGLATAGEPVDAGLEAAIKALRGATIVAADTTLAYKGITDRYEAAPPGESSYGLSVGKDGHLFAGTRWYAEAPDAFVGYVTAPGTPDALSTLAMQVTADTRLGSTVHLGRSAGGARPAAPDSLAAIEPNRTLTVFGGAAPDADGGGEALGKNAVVQLGEDFAGVAVDTTTGAVAAPVVMFEPTDSRHMFTPATQTPTATSATADKELVEELLKRGVAETRSRTLMDDDAREALRPEFDAMLRASREAAADAQAQEEADRTNGDSAHSAALATPITLPAEERPLGEMIALAATATGLALAVDGGIDLTTPVAGRGRPAPALIALHGLVAAASPDLRWVPERGHLRLTRIDPGDEEPVYRLVHDVTNIVSPDESTDKSADSGVREARTAAFVMEAEYFGTRLAGIGAVIAKDSGPTRVQVEGPMVAHLGVQKFMEDTRQACAEGLLPSYWLDQPHQEVRSMVASALDRLEQLRAEAQTRRLRIARLARVLDPQFWRFADAGGLPERLAPDYAGPRPEGAIWKDGGVLVSILTTDIQPSTLAALEAAGLEITDAIAGIPMVVGLAPLGRIDDMGMLECVRRIEPTQPVAQAG